MNACQVCDFARSALLLGMALVFAGSAAGQPVNTPYDSNANGTADSVIVDGDYDGDGRFEPEDIQAAIHGVNARLPGEAGSVIVRAHTYRELCRGPGDPPGYCVGDPHVWCYPGFGDLCGRAGLSGAYAICVPITCEGWDVRPYAGTGQPRGANAGLIDLGADDANLTLSCDAGARIEGIWNKRRFDGTAPPQGASGMGSTTARLLSLRGSHDVTVRGCDLDGGMPRGIGAYDPQAGDWPLVADGGTATSLVDADGGWLDGEWDRWWLMLRPGCEGPQTPHVGCSAPEEFVQITDTDATGTLTAAGFRDPPVAGDRYVILYHSGGVCSGDRSTPCLTDAGCGSVGGSCDLSVQDDPAHGSRQTLYLSSVENVRLESLRISGSAHAGFYAKNSHEIDLIDSELLENGGYYGHGLENGWPSIYLFSGVPEYPCFEGDTDCRLVGVRIQNTEIHHGGTGVNLRWAPKPGQDMYIEGLEVRDSWLHDLFAADGSAFSGILCDGKAAVCERNVVERAGGGIQMSGHVADGWASETPALGQVRNGWGIRVRDNTIRDLWKQRKTGTTFGLLVQNPYAEDLLFQNNALTRIGAGPGPAGPGLGVSVNGPNRNVTVEGALVTETSGTSLRFTNSGGAIPPVRAWREWPELEVDGEDLGVDPALHQGDPGGFDRPESVEKLELLQGGRISLRDASDAGHRGGVGGQAEALYVRTLAFGDPDSILNLNGLHLYYETLVGSESQIIDVPTSCPNGVLDPAEACDDGNAVWGDGCSPRCRLEQEVDLYGLAQGGGSVGLTVAGHAFSVPTGTLQNSIEVLAQLAEAVNGDPQLQQLGAGATSLGNRLLVEAAIDDFTVADGGFYETLPIIPALGVRGRLGLALGLLGAAAAWLARRRRVGV